MNDIVHVLLAALSGVLLTLSFPPWDAAPVAWVALVPLLLATRGSSPSRAALLGLLAGTLFLVATTSWVVEPFVRYTRMGPALVWTVFVAVSAYLGAFTAAFAAGWRIFESRGARSAWYAAALWTVLEWARGSLLLPLPWLHLGSSQYRVLPVLQLVEVTGVYGLSAAIVAVNVALARLTTWRGLGGPERISALATVGIVLILLPIAGAWRAAEVRRAMRHGGLRIAIVQPNVTPEEKWNPARQSEVVGRHAELSLAALPSDPQLVVWPEAAVPFHAQDPGVMRDRLLKAIARIGRPVLFGSPAWEARADLPARRTNRAWLVDAAGEVMGRYDKLRPVPFGEYVPMASLLPFVAQLAPGGAPIEPGESAVVLDLAGTRFGVLICYESLVPELAPALVAKGAGFLVNLTNDGWFGTSPGPRQAFAQATVRAVENRVALVRVANTGISAVVDPDGRVRWQSRLDERTWHVTAVGAGPGRSFYARYGNVFLWFAAVVVVVLCVSTIRDWAARTDRGWG